VNHPSAYRWLLWLIIALGVGLRMGWCWVHRDEFTDDRDGYIAHAQSVARGEGFLGPYSHRPTAFRPPAYPIAIGLLQRLGCNAATAVAMLNGISSLILLLCPLGMTSSATRCLTSGKLQLVTTFLIAFDPLLIRYTSLPMTEVPCSALLLCAVMLFIRSLELPEGDPAARRYGLILSALSGLLFAIGALTRPIILVSCLATGGIVCLSGLRAAVRQQDEGNGMPGHGRHRLLVSLVMLGCCGLGMSPWIVRNLVQFQKLIPASTHGGYTLALGNNDDFYRDVIRGNDQFPWDGNGLDRWQKAMIRQMNSEGVPQDSETAADAWYYARAKQSIQRDPSSFVKASLLRLRRFWALSTADEQVSLSIRMATAIWYGTVWFGLLIFIGQRMAIGRRHTLLSTVRNDSLATVILCGIIATFVMMHLIYWTDTRMRTPVMPILCSLSAYGLVAAYSALRDKLKTTPPR
jgi:hypothetical protein